MNNSTVQALRDFLIDGRNDLLSANPATQAGDAWLELHSRLIDETLRRIYHEAWRAARLSQDRVEHGEHEPELALLAIGGYGRAEMCPYSDIDIAFVPGEEENALLDAVIKEAFRLIVEVLIDGARLEVGYAYRPIFDCAHLDHTAKAALLECRLIAGSERLQDALRLELRARWDAVEFLLDKTEERREVSRRISHSLYSVEPNLKEGTGALREIHTALWAAGAMHPAEDPMRDLEWRGLVTASDCRGAREANDFFLKLRCWLHLTTKRKTDVLRVELQDNCARDMGYTGSGALPSQSLLRDYYRHAENALRFSQKVMRRLMEGPLPLDDHFVARHQRVRAAHPHVLKNHPELVMTPFALAAKYGFATDTELDRLVEEALPLMDKDVREHPIMRASFLSLLPSLDRAADALVDLRGRGVLQAFIPEFAAMLRLAPADPSHQLTVGEHSIHAVRKLGEMWSKRKDDEVLYAVWDGVDDLEILALGTLLHDVGKLEPQGDHAVSGARLAVRIGERLGFGPERLERLALLVRRHLLLPRVARLRDLSAPGTIRDVMEHARDVPTLKMLYLLSLADTRSVSERSYSAFELESMRELYERTLMAMTSAETAQALTDSEMREQMVQRERERVRREMRHLELDDETLGRLCDNLPASYVLNTPLPTIATHLRFLDQLPQEKLIVDFYQGPRDAFTEMTIVAYDDPEPGLLSKICGVVHAAGAEIHMAQVFTLFDLDGLASSQHETNGDQTSASAPHMSTHAAAATPEQAEQAQNDVVKNNAVEDNAVVENDVVESGAHMSTHVEEQRSAQQRGAEQRSIVLDRLHVARDGRPLSTTQCARLASMLREVLLGQKSVDEVLKSTGKTAASGLTPLKISARNDLSDEHSVLTVVNDNVPGLLFRTTRALAALHLDIHSAKITTWAGRAEDAFYVTRRNAATPNLSGAPGDDPSASGENDTFNGFHIVQSRDEINEAPIPDSLSIHGGRDRKLQDAEIRNTLDALRRELQKPA